ncbi:MAG: PAS domain S-box protein [Thermomicrobiales bacterium]
MPSEVQKDILSRVFRITREDTIQSLCDVLVAHQPEDGAIVPSELRRRAQGLVIGIQESLLLDGPIPGFLEELGAVAFGITDGSDDALFEILSLLENHHRAQIPPFLAEEMRRPLWLASKRLQTGWVSRRVERSPLPALQPVDESLLRSVIDQAPVGMMVLDHSVGVPVVFSRGLVDLFGYTLEEELALAPEQMQNEDSAEDDFDLLGEMVAGRIPFIERVSARPHKDGRSIPFRMLAWPVRDADGNLTHLGHFMFSGAPSTAQTAGSGLAEKRARYLMRISPDPVIVAALDGTIRYASPSVERAFGYDPDWLVGQPATILVTDSSLDAARAMLEEVALAPRAQAVRELESPRADGTTRWFEVIATNLLDVEDVQGMVFQGRDITERRELWQRLEHAARTDSLSGLLNRGGFLTVLKDWIANQDATDSDAANGSAVCYIDLDHFKTINDRFGHGAGDAAIAEVGARLRALIEGRGFAGRIGGDEFVVLAELSDQDARDGFLKDLFDALHGSIEHCGRDVAFTGSVGTIALRDRAARHLDASEILLRADDGLRNEKADRRQDNP